MYVFSVFCWLYHTFLVESCGRVTYILSSCFQWHRVPHEITLSDSNVILKEGKND